MIIVGQIGAGTHGRTIERLPKISSEQNYDDQQDAGNIGLRSQIHVILPTLDQTATARECEVRPYTPPTSLNYE